MCLGAVAEPHLPSGWTLTGVRLLLKYIVRGEDEEGVEGWVDAVLPEVGN